MNKKQALRISKEIHYLIFDTIEAREVPLIGSKPASIDRLAAALMDVDESEPTTNPVESCTCSADNPSLVTKDGCTIEAGILLTLYRVDSKAGNIETLRGKVSRDGLLFDNSPEHMFAHPVSELFLYHSDAAPPTFNTKDMQAVKVGSMQTLWMASGLTGEITRFTGRVDMKGNLFEIVGAEGEDIVPTFPINELYFWRVNLLKDELAAQSTSTAVEVEYSDNAEMELEQTSEYD